MSGSLGMVAPGPPVLEVRDLVTRFHTRGGTVHAVNGLSYSLRSGESLALVGESGSGKSVSALSVMGLVRPPGQVEGGRVRLRGTDLLQLSPREWRGIRGREMAMVFQDPLTALNPVLTVGRQLTEVLAAHTELRGAAARMEAARLLARVGIPDPARRLDAHPHEFSGGQRQRIVLAMALACRPAVLIADEPTTALDVTIQARIVALVRELQEEMGMAVLWITHDLALVAGLVDRVAVMYAGRIVEEAPVRELFRNPRHPYTRGLLGSLPTVGPQDAAPGRLESIPGQPPELLGLPRGCPFAPRCAHAVDRCLGETPPLLEVEPRRRDAGPGAGRAAVTSEGATAGSHRSACWRWEDL